MYWGQISIHQLQNAFANKFEMVTPYKTKVFAESELELGKSLLDKESFSTKIETTKYTSKINPRTPSES